MNAVNITILIWRLYAININVIQVVILGVNFIKRVLLIGFSPLTVGIITDIRVYQLAFSEKYSDFV